MTKHTQKDVMKRLKSLPEVQEHLNKLPVQLGKQILKRRIELNLTQQEVVALSKKHKKSITQAQLSKIEIGDENVTLQTYEKALYVLGLSDVKLEFSDKELIWVRQLSLAFLNYIVLICYELAVIIHCVPFRKRKEILADFALLIGQS